MRLKHTSKLLTVSLVWVAVCFVLRVATDLDDRPTLGFALVLISSAAVGICATIGESTAVGFIKALSPGVLVGWGSGTGIAGLTGGGGYLALKSAGVQFKTVNTPDLPQISLLLLPVPLLFYLAFRTIVSRIGNEQSIPKDRLEQLEKEEAMINEQLDWSTFKTVFRKVGGPISNLTAVYYFEYSILTSFAERAHPKSDEASGDWWQENAFIILGLCYQVGVFVSRSSLSYFKLKQLWILTTIQGFNYLLFFSVAYYKWMQLRYQLPLMVWVGLMGGTGYVNSYYQMLQTPELTKSLREIAINLAGAAITLGLLAAAGTAVFVSNFVIVTPN